MRSAGEFESEQQARLFADHLLTLGIDSEVSREADQWTVWVADEDRLEEAGAAREAFLRDPTASQYARVSAEADRIRQDAARKEKRKAPTLDMRERWAIRPGSRNVPVTIGLIAASLLVTFYTDFGRRRDIFVDLTFDPVQIFQHGQWWRFFTSIFVHFDPLHLIFDMLWLYHLGRLIESRRNMFFYILLVFVTASLSNCAQYLATGPNSGGMSGVVYGLFGYVWMKSRYEPFGDLHIERSTVYLMMGWLVLCWTGWLGPIGNWAHGVGLLVGAAFGIARPVYHKLFG